ncbi:MAG: hypothetical protein NZT61_04410 [Deltaproteobacteria bacterium]|nr:hypothetical protein [Deltaproteobacteria bacterium]MCX7952588.1 hypothetical protein [Deltaproteobacteria bacterium]
MILEISSKHQNTFSRYLMMSVVIHGIVFSLISFVTLNNKTLYAGETNQNSKIVSVDISTLNNQPEYLRSVEENNSTLSSGGTRSPKFFSNLQPLFNGHEKAYVNSLPALTNRFAKGQKDNTLIQHGFKGTPKEYLTDISPRTLLSNEKGKIGILNSKSVPYADFIIRVAKRVFFQLLNDLTKNPQSLSPTAQTILANFNKKGDITDITFDKQAPKTEYFVKLVRENASDANPPKELFDLYSSDSFPFVFIFEISVYETNGIKQFFVTLTAGLP